MGRWIMTNRVYEGIDGVAEPAESNAMSISPDRIEQAIQHLRSQKVLLDADLAMLYGVPTKVLNQAVKRNRKRFPPDFMFQLTQEEYVSLNSTCGMRSQIVTASKKRNVRHLPYAFTEQGVSMLSSVLGSDRAIQVNIAIMRAFVRLRELLASNRELSRRLDDLEARYDEQFRGVFEAIRQLMSPPAPPPKKRIGFNVGEARGRYVYRKPAVAR